MSKKRDTLEISLNRGENIKDQLQGVVDKILLEKEGRPYSITEAAIKDGFCNYTFEITSGLGLGDTHTVKGSGVIDDDMLHAFGKLNVHLAAIDDVFKHSNVDIEDINEFHGHELAHTFRVTGFKVSGGVENESVVLKGSKYVTYSGGRIELASPKIPLDNMSSYPWYNELKEAVDNVRREVELYKEGKYSESEVEQPSENPPAKQMKLGDKAEGDEPSISGDGSGTPLPEIDSDFEKAKV